MKEPGRRSVLPLVRSVAIAAATEDVEERAQVRRARAGDAGAFTTLIDRYDRGMRGLAYRLLGDRHRMDDALQEAYLKAFRALPSFAGQASFRSWLYRIVHNACMDELRRDMRRPAMSLEVVAEWAEPSSDPADVAADRRDLAAALASLPPDHRAVVLLVDAEGFDYDEAATVLGVPRGTIGSRLNRARATLRRALSEGVDEP